MNFENSPVFKTKNCFGNFLTSSIYNQYLQPNAQSNLVLNFQFAEISVSF